MKIAVLCANGKAGKLIVEEAINKGLEVSAFVRDSSKARFDSKVRVVQKDIFALESSDLQGFDVIIDAFGEWQNLSLHKAHMEHLVQILSGNSAKFLVVGVRAVCIWIQVIPQCLWIRQISHKSISP